MLKAAEEPSRAQQGATLTLKSLSLSVAVALGTLLPSWRDDSLQNPGFPEMPGRVFPKMLEIIVGSWHLGGTDAFN